MNLHYYQIVSFVFFALFQLNSPAQDAAIAVAGRLVVDVQADFLVAVDEQSHALNWRNLGTLQNTFGDFGFDGSRGQYPTLQAVRGAQAVVFDGDDFLRFGLKAPASVTGNRAFSLEVWAFNPTIGERECLVSWAGEGNGQHAIALGWGTDPERGAVFHGDKVTTGYQQVPEANAWQHLALTYTGGAGGVESLYVNGKRVMSRAISLNIAPRGTIRLGCDANEENHFSGAIAAVRIHEGAMTEQQILHNYNGGVELGAALAPNIHPDARGAAFAAEDTPGLKTRASKHFRSAWLAKDDVEGVMDERTRAQLAQAEDCYEIFTKRLGLPAPIVSMLPERRGDGKRYKIEIGNDWRGANLGGYMVHGFGYPSQGAGYINPHELAHACQTHSNGSFPNWHEAYADWLDLQTPLKKGAVGSLYPESAHLWAGDGRHFYHCWLIFQHLSEAPEYGPLFMAKLLHTAQRDEYLWNVARRIDPDPSTPFIDEWIKMARRNVTGDFYPRDRFELWSGMGHLVRYGRVVLEPEPFRSGWYRVPAHKAPQQLGFNVCPLEPTQGRVTARLAGWINPQRGSDWRCSFVAVSEDGKPRYGEIWGQGQGAIELDPETEDLYLVVCATPTKLVEIDRERDSYRGLKKHQFPYQVELDGAVPLDRPMFKPSPLPGSPHPNGGGFVADTAHVEPTAYVGPRAVVLAYAQVLGNARIEGQAVVANYTVVKDHAVVSGHALVAGNAVVEDHARVRDFAVLEASARVSDFAKVLQHAHTNKRVSDHAVLKGSADAQRGSVSGTAIVDGAYAKPNEIERGSWLTWNWGPGKNVGEYDIDLEGVYARYLFETPHPYLAWDTYGVTHGFLHGNPRIVRDPQRTTEAAPNEFLPDENYKTLRGGSLTLNGRDQWVELPRDIADMLDLTIDATVKWTGEKQQERILEFAGKNASRLFLTPADADGKAAFVIENNGRKQSLQAPAPLTKNAWTQLQVVLEGDSATFLIDGQTVAVSQEMTLDPEDVRATVGLLGRGLEGNFFNGEIEQITFYSIPLIDHMPPTPNPAQWRIRPTALNPSSVAMLAAKGSDPHAPIEYYFEELTGKRGGNDSGWQASPFYRDDDLEPGSIYAYRLRLRDPAGNETSPAERVDVSWDNPKAFVPSGGANGPIVIEAESYHANHAPDPDGPRWKTDATDPGFSGAGVMNAWAQVHRQINSRVAESSPRLDYRVRFQQAGDHWLWTRATGFSAGEDSVHIGLDFQKLGQGTSGVRTSWGAYAWIKHGEPIRVDKAGSRIFSIWMREDGTMLDKFILTPDETFTPGPDTDAQGRTLGLGPPESPQE
ncbi:DUF6055 domain-containing protein [Candidatus Sumerlaeota bacterium]